MNITLSCILHKLCIIFIYSSDSIADLLKSSSSGRIVNSAGFVHGWGEFGTIQFNTQSSPYTAYCNSQLAMVMFTRELAIRLQGTGEDKVYQELKSYVLVRTMHQYFFLVPFV